MVSKSLFMRDIPWLLSFLAIRRWCRIISPAALQHFRRADQSVERIEIEHALAERLRAAVGGERGVVVDRVFGQRAHDTTREKSPAKNQALRVRPRARSASCRLRPYWPSAAACARPAWRS